MTPKPNAAFHTKRVVATPAESERASRAGSRPRVKRVAPSGRTRYATVHATTKPTIPTVAAVARRTRALRCERAERRSDQVTKPRRTLPSEVGRAHSGQVSDPYWDAVETRAVRVHFLTLER